MQRRGFFGGLAVLVMAPSVLIRKQKAEKHWVCLSCGEPVGDQAKIQPGIDHYADTMFTGSEGAALEIRGAPGDCLNCGASVSCTAWK